MNNLLISINSINENTGGGLYLRCIINELTKNNSNLDLLCKKGNKKNIKETKINKIIYFKKNTITDLFSRLLITPCFLGLYTLKILFLILKGNYSSVHFHSSRTIPIAILVKLLFKCKVHMHFDNVEYKLSKKIAKNFKEIPLRIIDSFLLYIYENNFVNFLSSVSFITESDRNEIKPTIKNYILPIKIPSRLNISNAELTNNRCLKNEKKILFVASFDHTPNIDAAIKIIFIASCNLNLNFLIVGRNAKKLEMLIKEVPNIEIRSNVDDDELQNIYLDSHLVLCPVQDGGGMKTKIAEAMAYKLPVLCTAHSAIGYDAVINKTEFIKIVDFNNCSNDIERILKMYNDCNKLQKNLDEYYKLFQNNYCY